jgi:hypothetical protein
MEAVQLELDFEPEVKYSDDPELNEMLKEFNKGK